MKDKRYNVNFNNARIKEFCATLALGENRMDKDRFNEICTTDNLYSLVHSHYIKVEDGIITSTQKLRREIEERYDTRFSTSCSEDHSRLVSESIGKLIPQSVLTSFNFRTAADIERDFQRTENLGDISYQKNLEQIKAQFQQEQERAKQEYERSLEQSRSEQERAMLQLEYARKQERSLVREHALELERPFLFPDYEVSVSRSELDELIENLRSEERNLEEDRTKELYQDAIEKLENIPSFEGRINISIEITTDSYGNAEIERHEIYEEVTDTIQIIL